ncbi:hypothetical protein ACFPYI_15990 [Halomarina salina]|uniref:Uncharacterized protein n=1 Tax=Halomarina salina TaxID=1872699 RepID=A0ABD5RR79_9EURY|nr:hypothetical protein [Halomarina salina]
MDQSEVSRMLRDAGTNALLAWLLVAGAAAVAVGNVAVGERLWALFALGVATVGAFPALARRSLRAMPPWEVLGLAALPLVVRSVGDGTVSDVTTYIAVAALALLVAVELDVFTAVEMSYSFAVFFVVVTTMAAAGIWAVVRWVADIYLGTGFVVDERALMLEFVASTVAGVGAGVVFELYFRRFARGRERLEADL